MKEYLLNEEDRTYIKNFISRFRDKIVYCERICIKGNDDLYIDLGNDCCYFLTTY